MSTTLAVGLDLASVHGAVVGQVPGKGVVFERSVDAPPKSEIDSPVRDLRMAALLCRALTDCAWSANLPADVDRRILLIEHTPFNPHQTGAAQTGVVRGALYTTLGFAGFDEVYLVNPSQWRSFHSITATGKEKWMAYSARAALLGFLPNITKTLKAEKVKQEQDLVAAFLISCFAANFVGPSADLIKSKPNLRIV